jgi:hypothetical protein
LEKKNIGMCGIIFNKVFEYKKGEGLRLENTTAANSLDFLFRQLREELSTNNNRLLRKTTLAQNFVVTLHNKTIQHLST